MSSANSPLTWSLARTLTRLCHQYDKSPHLKSLLKSPFFTEAMHKVEYFGAESTPSAASSAFSPLERTIIKQIYPSDQQIYYKPVPKSFQDILRRVWRLPAESDTMQSERLDAAFTFIRILNQNLKMRTSSSQSESLANDSNDASTDSEDKETFYEQFFGTAHEHSPKTSLDKDPSSTESTQAPPSLLDYNIQLLSSSSDLKPGSFLVSHPLTREGVFYKTIIYIAEHDNQQGTLGFVINKTTNHHNHHAAMRAALAGIARPVSSSLAHTQLRSGGPVVSGKHRIVKLKETGKVVALRSTSSQSTRQRQRTLKKQQTEEDKISVDTIDKEVQFVNSSEWMPQQLENEIERGSWFLCSADVDLIFDKADSGESLWEEFMRALGGEYEDFVRVNNRRSKLKKKRSSPSRVHYALSL